MVCEDWVIQVVVIPAFGKGGGWCLWAVETLRAMEMLWNVETSWIVAKLQK